MTERDLIAVLDTLPKRFETEVLELKEATNSFRPRDLGVYFSALSNEANLRGLPYALLIFGLSDKGKALGTSYYQEQGWPEKKSKGLQRLKKEIAENTGARITFREIHEILYQGKRVVAFEIPPAVRGIPTQWAGAAWAREGESLVPLPLDKIDEIRAQPPADWGKGVVSEATLDDLDPKAIRLLRAKMVERYGVRSGIIADLSDAELLDKAGITLRGKVTNAALALIGKEESEHLIEGPVPRITWTLYEADGHARAYEHFGPPLALSIDAALAKVRNESVRLLRAGTAVPRVVAEYDPWTLRELVGNALAHQDYSLGRHISVNEFPDRIEVANEGGFIPGSLETALAPGYKPPYYRNPFLCDALFSIGILDRDALGIRTMFENAYERWMPMPRFNLRDGTGVTVTLANHELNSLYTELLATNEGLPAQTLLALDSLQRGGTLSATQESDLLSRGLAERAAGGLRFVATPKEGKLPSVAITEKSFDTAVLNAVAAGLSTTAAIAARLSAEGESGDVAQKVYRSLKRLESAGNVASEGSTRARTWKIGKG